GGGGGGNGGARSAPPDASTGQPVLGSCESGTATHGANPGYPQPRHARRAGPRSAAPSGAVGGPRDRPAPPARTPAKTSPRSDPPNGSVVQAARVALDDGVGTLALGFGISQAEAVGAAEGSLASSFGNVLASFKQGWKNYDHSLNDPHLAKQLEDEYYLSANVIKASEDKMFPGSIVASLASPWGQAISAGDPANTYFGSYREVFARDLYEAWTGLVADGDLDPARAATLFLLERHQLPHGSMPRNSLVNGKTAPDSFNTQLDECAYPILMADQLGLTDAALYSDHIKPAANFIVSHGPAAGPERWE